MAKKEKGTEIKTPNPAFNGERYGVQFVNGVAYVSEPIKIAWFRQNGYIVDGKIDNEAVNNPKQLPATPPTSKEDLKTVEEDEDLETIEDEEDEEDEDEGKPKTGLRKPSIKINQ